MLENDNCEGEPRIKHLLEKIKETVFRNRREHFVPKERKRLKSLCHVLESLDIAYIPNCCKGHLRYLYQNDKWHFASKRQICCLVTLIYVTISHLPSTRLSGFTLSVNSPISNDLYLLVFAKSCLTVVTLGSYCIQLHCCRKLIANKLVGNFGPVLEWYNIYTSYPML